DNVSGNAPKVIVDEVEFSPRSISKVSLMLWRDTRNDLVFTTRGSRISVASTFAGIGGDTEYMKLEARSAFFLPTFEFGDQVLSILGRIGSIWEYSDLPTPFFDRFYLGGPDSLRGFEYREVGPVSSQLAGDNYTGEPIGGNSFAFASFEYSIKIADPLRVAIFYDWGFVNRDDFDFNPASYNDNWGVGIRLLVLGNPLRLDLGLPMTSKEIKLPDGTPLWTNDKGNQFNFSFGTRF
ncbi:MAG TPA: BamA/TamA family outer membrane protein, partial [Oceanipulchritudo sp.]|nr:BamA/TamA family outer membrane protein [Oceanipulchritudo sp.]